MDGKGRIWKRGARQEWRGEAGSLDDGFGKAGEETNGLARPCQAWQARRGSDCLGQARQAWNGREGMGRVWFGRQG